MIRLSATSFIDDLLADPDFGPRFVHIERIPARAAEWAPMPSDIHPDLLAALASQGVDSLYSHQAMAYQLARSGRDFVVVTPTASGKTLCYNLPVVQALLEEPSARALYLFPTKALSQDQQAALNEVALGGNLPLRIYTYDGDTPDSLRVAARDRGRIVISNPDMLHSGVLPNHAKWIHFFSNLRYVVVDEMHAYRGVFGSHVANVLRRLLRIAAFYGANPRFILCSATIGNPRELAHALIGRDVEEVAANGAPRGERVVLFYNPPLVDPVQGIRKSTATESEGLAVRLLKAGVKTILFARSRLKVELIASYIAETLANPFNRNNGIEVSPYRSGLLPSERRAIEKGLREGSIQGVVSTNALELGIDIGGLDAAVVAGFPGAFASFWQQAGRAGRRGSVSLAILVASSSPLDQYIIAHPEYFFGRSPEKARVDPDNPYIFMDHLKCAAFELPFSEGEAFGKCAERGPSGEDPSGEALGAGVEEPVLATEEGLSLLEEEGTVRKTGGRWYWSDQGYPSEKISLRSAAADNVVIVDETGGGAKVIGEMDRPSAKELIFDNAVYIHLGRQYLVRKLDIENRTCHVAEKDVDYWTDSVVKTDIEMLTEDERFFKVESTHGSRAVAECVLGDVLVRSQAEKFKKLRFHSHENVGYGEISLPPEEMQTRAIVLLFPAGTKAGDELAAGNSEAFKAAVLSGAGRLLHDIAPAFLMCDPRDLGRAERVRDPHFGCSAIYFFDRYPGGTGLAEGFAQLLSSAVSAARERLASCPCGGGCPSCIGVDFAAAERGQAGLSSTLDGSEVKARVVDLLGALGDGG